MREETSNFFYQFLTLPFDNIFQIVQIVLLIFMIIITIVVNTFSLCLLGSLILIWW